jgi:succinate dehydrogenase / fumarate reductase cytochrome b subunit
LTAKELLNKLSITNQTIQSEKNDPGIENFMFSPKAFAKNFAATLAKAGKNGETIIALDNSSLLSLKQAKSYILNNDAFKQEVEKTLNRLELTTAFLANIVHINAFLLDKDTIEYVGNNLKHSFENFKAAAYIGPSLDFDAETNKNISSLLEAMKLKRLRFEREFLPSGYNIYKYSPRIAYKMSGAILFDAYDSGADFLISNDAQTFYMFDVCRKEIEKVVGRSTPIYLLTPSQMILMALGITDKKTLGFDSYKVKPTIIS